MIKSLSKIIKAIIAGLLIALASLLTAGCSQSGSRESAYQFAEDAKDGEYVLPTHVPGQSEDQKEPSYFMIQVNASPTVSRGGKRCNLMIGNPTENEQYVKVKLILDDTEAGRAKCLCRSGTGTRSRGAYRYCCIHGV